MGQGAAGLNKPRRRPLYLVLAPIIAKIPTATIPDKTRLVDWLMRFLGAWSCFCSNIPGLTRFPAVLNAEKCKCGPVLHPVVPTSPIFWPALTLSPFFTNIFDRCA